MIIMPTRLTAFTLARGLHASFAAITQIVQMHDFTLYIEIQLPRQEAQQVLVNEIAKSVLGNVPVQMLFQQIGGVVAFARGDRCYQSLPRGQVILEHRFADGFLVFVEVYRLFAHYI